jgi:predicted Rossmann-fold nucleotide-binding protein
MFCHAAVVIMNVNGFYEPLKLLIQQALSTGFIRPHNVDLVVFVDPPKQGVEGFDWGHAAIDALSKWKPPVGPPLFDWSAGKADAVEAI